MGVRGIKPGLRPASFVVSLTVTDRGRWGVVSSRDFCCQRGKLATRCSAAQQPHRFADGAGLALGAAGAVTIRLRLAAFTGRKE